MEGLWSVVLGCSCGLRGLMQVLLIKVGIVCCCSIASMTVGNVIEHLKH